MSQRITKDADTVKGAKAYADSLITDLGAVFEFKGVVADYAALTALTGMEKGDVYLVTADENQAGTPANAEYVYDGAKWELLGNTALDPPTMSRPRRIWMLIKSCSVTVVEA